MWGRLSTSRRRRGENQSRRSGSDEPCPDTGPRKPAANSNRICERGFYARVPQISRCKRARWTPTCWCRARLDHGRPVTASGWDTFRTAVDQLLWFYPDFGVHFSLASDQIQLRGELIEGAKAEGTRTAQKWIFEEAQATLPGETAIRLTGALKKTAGKPELMARVCSRRQKLRPAQPLDLARWLQMQKRIRREFSQQADCSHFRTTSRPSQRQGRRGRHPVYPQACASTRHPVRKLKVSLAGDSFDLTSLESGQTGAEAL